MGLCKVLQCLPNTCKHLPGKVMPPQIISKPPPKWTVFVLVESKYLPPLCLHSYTWIFVGVSQLSLLHLDLNSFFDWRGFSKAWTFIVIIVIWIVMPTKWPLPKIWASSNFINLLDFDLKGWLSLDSPPMTTNRFLMSWLPVGFR